MTFADYYRRELAACLAQNNAYDERLDRFGYGGRFARVTLPTGLPLLTPAQVAAQAETEELVEQMAVACAERHFGPIYTVDADPGDEDRA